MTDPIQGINPQQQGQQQQGNQSQQPPTDDILAGEDIFTTIPEMEIPEDEEGAIEYSDSTPETPYTFEPIPEIEEEPTSVQQLEPEPELEPEESIASVADQEIQNIEQQAGLEETKIDSLLDTKLQTDVQKKFGELFFTTKRIYELKEQIGVTEETFDILGANNDKVFISYRFFLDETNEPMLFIAKTEQDRETEEETVNELRFTFNEETSSLEVMVNDTLIFDEVQDLTEDTKKKMQVIDKLNKFIFLSSEELRKTEKEIKEREESEQERKKLQEIFRNF